MAERLGIGSLAFGALPGVTESMEMMRKAWTSMSLPSGLAPTVSLEDLDRRIADLEAVEHWLDMNLGMLRGTVQALQIQRGTLAALSALGRAAAEGGASAEALIDAVARIASTPAPAAKREGAAAPASSPSPAGPGEQAAPGLATGIGTAAMNPAAWWELLQGQFNQVAQAALSGASLQGTSSHDPSPGAGPGGNAKAASTRGKSRPASTKAARANRNPPD